MDTVEFQRSGSETVFWLEREERLHRAERAAPEADVFRLQLENPPFVHLLPSVATMGTILSILLDAWKVHGRQREAVTSINSQALLNDSEDDPAICYSLKGILEEGMTDDAHL